MVGSPGIRRNSMKVMVVTIHTVSSRNPSRSAMSRRNPLRLMHNASG